MSLYKYFPLVILFIVSGCQTPDAQSGGSDSGADNSLNKVGEWTFDSTSISSEKLSFEDSQGSQDLVSKASSNDKIGLIPLFELHSALRIKDQTTPDYLSTGSTSDFDLTDNLTVQFWLRIDDSNTDNIYLVDYRNGTSPSENGYRVYINVSNEVCFRTYDSQDTLNTSLTVESSPLNTDQWYLITCTYDSSADSTSRSKIFLDTSLSVTGEGSIGSNSPDTLNVAGSTTDPTKDRNLKGALDNLVIYNSTLSQSQISTVFNQVDRPIINEPLFSYPGLRNSDGSAHITPEPHPTTGSTITVTGFDPDDNDSDDLPFIIDAINNASSGDEIYLPDGVYNLIGVWGAGKTYQISPKTGVNIRGESEAGTILKSHLDSGTYANPTESYKVIYGYDKQDIVIENLTITSDWDKTYSLVPTSNNSDAGGAANMIYFKGNSSSDSWTERIYIKNVTVEKFRLIGIRADDGCRDVVFQDCTAKNATDTGGGGSGYAFQFDGKFDNGATSNPNLGTTADNYFNVMDGCETIGPYIRHAALIQYWAHNNLVTNCTFEGTQYDAIDMHGEDEYNNEISYNTVSNVTYGAGIGIGNSGGTSVVHDKTGPYNWYHHNSITNCLRGIDARYGTPLQVIENNTISQCEDYGIYLGFTTDFVIRNNTIQDNTDSGFKAVYLYQNSAEGYSPAGSPINCYIYDNTLTNNSSGIDENGYGEDNFIHYN